MARQLSTSISDAILAWSVLYFIYNVFWVNFFSCLGLGIQGTAAALGVVRFAQQHQQGQIYDYHMMASWLARVSCRYFYFRNPFVPCIAFIQPAMSEYRPIQAQHIGLPFSDRAPK